MSFVETVVKWVMRKVWSAKRQRFYKVPVRREYRLSPFFRSTLSWTGEVVEEEGESPLRIKILASVFTFHKCLPRSKLQPFIDDEIVEYIRAWQDAIDIIQSGYECENVAHGEALGLGFYRVAVTIDDVEVRREGLH